MKEPSSVVLEMQVTEKGTAMNEAQNKVLFRVARSANKIEIKRAVEKLFNVTVTGVNTMNYLGKRRRERTVRYGRRPDWKRAVVTLKPGDTIDVT
ncbi:MAG: 50S ribosomal protein L23 [Lentisphaerae bacterium]|nr:50S ribosomal protein L23 [Lentisphaerota bacterium]